MSAQRLSDSGAEETQDQDSSHSNYFINDSARPEETQDPNSSHSNHFSNDGTMPGTSVRKMPMNDFERATWTQKKPKTKTRLTPTLSPTLAQGLKKPKTKTHLTRTLSPTTAQGLSDSGAEETQDKTSFHSNPFTYDGARPARVTKPKNVILFGETGVGKSSIINLMADAEIATTSSKLEGCTLEATEYSFTLSGETQTPLCIFDTVGLNEPKMGVNTFFGAIEEAHRLITSLHHSGGIDLLLFCIRGGRINATMQPNYRLFFEFLCEKKVPLAFIVTNLEN
ncbi:hypothetical protein EV363DRAFT_1446163 [Boletus edulis]|nr:hypothetical protein EV363DRAFT_1446163 [Boletus edulis]